MRRLEVKPCLYQTAFRICQKTYSEIFQPGWKYVSFIVRHTGHRYKRGLILVAPNSFDARVLISRYIRYIQAYF